MTLVVSNAINTVERLEQRVACNRADPGSFRRFVQRLLAVREDDVALDLGAGLGEQLIPVAQKAARAVGLDVSAEIVEALRPRLPGANASALLGDMDELAELDLRGPFTLAYSVYSVYYSRDPARLVRSVAGLLAGSQSSLRRRRAGGGQQPGLVFRPRARSSRCPPPCSSPRASAATSCCPPSSMPSRKCAAATLRQPGRLRERGRSDALLRRLRALLPAGATRGGARVLRAKVRAGRRLSDLQARARTGRDGPAADRLTARDRAQLAISLAHRLRKPASRAARCSRRRA